MVKARIYVVNLLDFINSISLMQKTLEVLSLLRPIVHDTSKTAKIIWFLLVVHWPVDVIEVIYYIMADMS